MRNSSTEAPAVLRSDPTIAPARSNLNVTFHYWIVIIADICGWLNIVDGCLLAELFLGEGRSLVNEAVTGDFLTPRSPGEIRSLQLPRTPSRLLWKAIVDKIISLVLLIFFIPLFVFIALAIKLDSRGPVLFVQERFGFNNNRIRVLKFRTMRSVRIDHSGARRGDPRVTRIGRFLRRLSLDELPQLINVLRGDMSLVGPRPIHPAVRAGNRLYSDLNEYWRHHSVKPGITGWAQVHGLRGEVDTPEKARARFEYDLYYFGHWSPWFDVKILLLRLRHAVSRADAY